MSINSEIYNGMDIMKYSLNHVWKFKHPKTAFLAGFLQVIICIFICLINYFVIVQAGDVLDLAKDFTALMIIAQFDDAFAQSSRQKLVKSILDTETDSYEDLFKIETTTS